MKSGRVSRGMRDIIRKYVELADRDLKDAHTRASPVDNWKFRQNQP